jgi:hypothetical protein
MILCFPFSHSQKTSVKVPPRSIENLKLLFDMIPTVDGLVNEYEQISE